MKNNIFTVLFILTSLHLMAQQGQMKSSTATLNDHAITPGKRVTYDLYIKDSIVNYSNKPAHAMAINGQIPGPELQFTEGDTAYITVHNLMSAETSLHWHGILIPNQYDGVPYLTTVPIKPNTSHVFVFPLKQTGTYWYHSHSMLEEQSGLYGSIVIHPQKKAVQFPEQVLLFSDWTDKKPSQVLRMLKRQTDWFAIQKGSVQSYGEAASKGYFSDKLKQEWMRMPAMDISDVKYDRFLVNGTTGADLSKFTPGETVRLRLIDGSSSTYFWIQFAGGKMTVVAADGLEVKPVVVDKLLIGIAETYDVLVTIPKSGKYEFRATAQDVSGKVSAYFGSGQTTSAPDIPKIPYFKMMHSMNNMMAGMNGMAMGAVASDKVKNDGLKLGMDKGDKMNMDGMGMGDMKMKKDTMPMKPVSKKDMKMDEMGDMDMSGMKAMKMKKDTTPMKAKLMDKMDMKVDDMGDMDMMDMNGMKDDGRGKPKTLPLSMKVTRYVLTSFTLPGICCVMYGLSIIRYFPRLTVYLSKRETALDL